VVSVFVIISSSVCCGGCVPKFRLPESEQSLSVAVWGCFVSTHEPTTYRVIIGVELWTESTKLATLCVTVCHPRLIKKSVHYLTMRLTIVRLAGYDSACVSVMQPEQSTPEVYGRNLFPSTS